MKMYFVDGLAPQIGRNTIYLINKIFNVAENAPVITDFLGVAFMMIAATLLCAVFKECSEDRIEEWTYIAFLATRLSFSLTAEVFVYYLHNGIGLAYVLTTLALIALWGNKGNKISRSNVSGLLLMFAVTCWKNKLCFKFCWVTNGYMEFFDIRGKSYSLSSNAGNEYFRRLYVTVTVQCIKPGEMEKIFTSDSSIGCGNYYL